MTATKTYKTGDIPDCPHCGKTLEEPIENHAIAGRTGEASRSEGDCGWCDKLYSVEKTGDDTFELTPLAGSR